MQKHLNCVSIRRILPVGARQDVMDVLLRSLRVESDLPATAQAQAADISGRLDEITKRLRPELLAEVFRAIEAGSLSRLLVGELVPELAGLIESGLQDLAKEENRFLSITQRVEEAYRRAVEVQIPMAEFLSRRAPQDQELAGRIAELSRFKDALATQKEALARLGEKISSTKQGLVALREQAARLGQQPSPRGAAQQP